MDKFDVFEPDRDKSYGENITKRQIIRGEHHEILGENTEERLWGKHNKNAGEKIFSKTSKNQIDG
jgi:hypothetical protein